MSKLKIISQKSEDNIKTEKKILSKINHPFIVNMFFSFQDNDNLYLIMDLLSGGDLRYHINHRKTNYFNEIQTKFFISNIIIALEYIHNQKIIHRDIKPENLLLDKNGYIHLTDFGIALINDKNNSSLKETSGTEGYMAPEVILRQGHSYPADFFAIGVIGYELMLGHRPYCGKNRRQMKNLILSYQAIIKFNKIKKGWSENSRDFINKLLQRRPIKRLGYSGIKEIKNHPWLKDINWDLLKKKKIKAPYIPKEGKDYFDTKFCQEDTTCEKYFINQYKYIFENYTFININYISKINNNQINNNIEIENKNSIINDLNKIEFNIKNIRQSFSERGKRLCSHKNIKDFLYNNYYLNTQKICKTSKNKTNKENSYLHSYHTKEYSQNITHQLYLNDKDKSPNKTKSRNIGKDKNNDKNKIKIKINKKLTNHHYYSSNKIIKQKKRINLKDIHNLIVKSLIKSTFFKKVLSMNSSKQSNDLINSNSCRSTRTIINKSKTNYIINFKKNTINNNQKEKKNIFNSNTKEKAVDNKDRTYIKKMNTKPKINKINKNNKNNNNKSKTQKTKDINYSINENIIINKNININKESLYLSLYFINSKKNNSIFSSRNKIIHKAKLNIKEDTIINFQKNKIYKNYNNNNSHIYSKRQGYKNSKNMNMNKDSNNKSNNINKDNYTSNLLNIKNDYNIKTYRKKIFKINNFDNINSSKKNLISLDSLNKNNSINKNCINTLLNSKSNYNSSRQFSTFKKYKKFYEEKNNKFFSSKIFNKFRKKIKNMKLNDKKYKSLSNENIKKENKNSKNNNLNGDNLKKDLEIEDYVKNTGINNCV